MCRPAQLSRGIARSRGRLAGDATFEIPAVATNRQLSNTPPARFCSMPDQRHTSGNFSFAVAETAIPLEPPQLSEGAKSLLYRLQHGRTQVELQPTDGRDARVTDQGVGHNARGDGL